MLSVRDNFKDTNMLKVKDRKTCTMQKVKKERWNGYSIKQNRLLE